MDMRHCIRELPDYPKPGILFYDITPLLGNAEAFAHAIDALYEATRHLQPTKIVAAEARGFLFAAPLALRLNTGFAPIRKPGKLPCKSFCVSYTLEYDTNTLCMHEDALTPDDRVLIVDDVLATGGTLDAMLRLIDMAGAHTVGCAVLLELAALNGRAVLADTPLTSLIQV